MTEIRAISWKKAAGFSLLAAYGPFIVMAIYTLLFLSCSHCKATAWMLLPCAPGLIPFEAGILWLHLPKPANTLSFVAPALIVSLALVFLLMCLARGNPRIGYSAWGTAFVAFSSFAFILLAKIRA